MLHDSVVHDDDDDDDDGDGDDDDDGGSPGVGWPEGSQRVGWCGSQDPFELSHDLGRTMDRQTTCVLHKEFERAASLLRDDAEPLGRLLEPYRVAKYDS